MEKNIFELDREPSFPPLITGRSVTGTTDPFAKACAMAALGCDSGILVYNLAPDTLSAAVVFAPETPLRQALSILPVCGVAIQAALGALAPPEVAVHLTWAGQILVNGGVCGKLRLACATDDPAAEPNWLVVGLALRLVPASADDPGLTPDMTSLYAEGCSEVSPVELLEIWSRHVLVWTHTLEADGRATLHREWRGLVHGIGDQVSMDIGGETVSGSFLGVDEHFGMLLRESETTHLIELTTLLHAGRTP